MEEIRSACRTCLGSWAGAVLDERLWRQSALSTPLLICSRRNQIFNLFVLDLLKSPTY